MSAFFWEYYLTYMDGGVGAHGLTLTTYNSCIRMDRWFASFDAYIFDAACPGTITLRKNKRTARNKSAPPFTNST